jgi:hypothetical protein
VAPGFVALGEVELLVEVLVVGEVVVELVVGDEVVVEVLNVVELLVVAELVAVVGVHCDTSWLIVDAPWPRLDSSVRLTEGGRLATALLSEVAALDASSHWWDASADEIVFS